MDKISEFIAPLGYEVVYVEVSTHRQKVLRLFIDHLESVSDSGEEKRIGIEDCVRVTRALDEPLENLAEVEKVFGDAPYELEVSSPGMERPLRKARDFERFAGKAIRIHVFRPLNAEELENADYATKNPKQKNFQGSLVGLENGKIVLTPSAQEGKAAKKGKKKSPLKEQEMVVETPRIRIPLALVSKANLEPDFDGLDESGHGTPIEI